MQERLGIHEGRFLLTRAIDWREKEILRARERRPRYASRWQKLISLILERLSTSSEELTRGELKQRLIERVERKKEALEAKKQAEDDLKTAGLLWRHHGRDAWRRHRAAGGEALIERR